MKKNKTDNTKRMKSRFNIICAFFGLVMLLIAFQLIRIVLFDGDRYAQAALAQTEEYGVTLTAKRGDIIDCNNVVLATSTMQYKLILDPKVILTNQERYLEPTASLIEECFDISASDVIEKVLTNPDRQYLILKKGLTYSEVKDFIELKNENINVAGVWLEDGLKRNYTYGNLACSVLGFMENDSGSYGLESYYDSYLKGTDGTEYTYVTSENIVETVRKEAEAGYTVQTTIDYNIQEIVERYMKQTLIDSGAQTVAVIVQNPNTGEIYAMADTGTFDPNDPRNIESTYISSGSEDDEEMLKSLEDMNDSETAAYLNDRWNNFCVSETFEPGSTFKVFTVAGALEENVIDKDQYFFCGGSVDIRDYTIHCSNTSGHATISLKDAMAQSCNMALITIAEALGVEKFCKYQSEFGFGHKTGIDLPMEMSCASLLYTTESMMDIDLATNSFGQSFNVTMIQLSSAFCSVINGGNYYKPYIVKGIYNSEGEQIKTFSKTLAAKVISEDTSDYLKEALREVVVSGTGTSAAVPGYIISGKTGTAEKGNRDEDLWVASFIGFAPYDDPEVVCYVVIDEPASGGEGSSSYACQLYKNIMSELLPYLNVKKADEDHDPAGVGSPEEESAVYYYEETGDDTDYGYDWGYDDTDYGYDWGYDDTDYGYDWGYDDTDYSYDWG